MNLKLIIVLVLVTLGTTSILNGCNNTRQPTNSENEINLSENKTTNYVEGKTDTDNLNTDGSKKVSNVSDKKQTADVADKKETSENLISKSNEYEIISKTYNKNNVKINYPQIKNFDDSEKLKSINKDLQEEALSILDDYVSDDPNLTTVTLNINYEIKLKNEKYISIVYSGDNNITGAAYPLSIFYTANIDIAKGSSIRLVDYANINDILNKLKDSNNIKVLIDGEELAEAQKSALLNIEDDKLINMLKNADFYKTNGKVESPKDGTYSYLDNDGIIFSIQVNHAIGDHAEFKLSN